MLVNILPFSSMGYPQKSAAVLYFSNCNYQCNICHNLELTNTNITSQTTIKEVISFLKKQKGHLEAVSLAGCEPLLTKEAPMLIKAIKAMGYLIKLETSGSNLKSLKTVAPYLDYISIDMKAAPDDYDRLTKHPGAWVKVRETLTWVIKSGIAYEFYTTVSPEWHTLEKLKIISNIVGRSEWYLQQYQERVFEGRSRDKYSDKDLFELSKALKCQVRGLTTNEGRGGLFENVAP